MAQTNFPSVPAKADSLVVTVIPIATILTNTNSFRDSYVITNIGDVTVYLNYGLNCDPVIHIFALKPKAVITDNYVGIISGCTDSATGAVLITEKL